MISEERAGPRLSPDREDYYLATDVLHARLHHNHTRLTHVVVGDHAPEPKARGPQVPQYASYGPSDKQRWLECPGAPRVPKRVEDAQC